jgi:hypothetical protein
MADKKKKSDVSVKSMKSSHARRVSKKTFMSVNGINSHPGDAKNVKPTFLKHHTGSSASKDSHHVIMMNHHSNMADKYKKLADKHEALSKKHDNALG